MAEFRASTILDCSTGALRSFLGRPANLPRVSDPQLELEILSAPELVEVGAKIEFRISAYGFKQRAVHIYTVVTDSEISEDLVEGPLPSWRHRQLFTSLNEGRTELEDYIEFSPPGGMVGYMMTEARIRESLEAGMSARYSSLLQLVRSGELT